MKAKILIEEGYQRPPLYGDQVEVKGRLFLPTKGYFLDPRIRFYTYVFVCGEALRDNWGEYDPVQKMRCKVIIGRGLTFEEAIRDIYGYVNSELDKLKKALKERRDVLKHAGEFAPKEIDFQLPVLKAKICIEKISQREPGIDNKLLVEGRILLPVNKNNKLADEFQFGSRVSICDDILHPSWGQYDKKKKMRYKKIHGIGTTCKEAIENLEKVAFKELEKLESVLEERKTILENAGRFKEEEKIVNI